MAVTRESAALASFGSSGFSARLRMGKGSEPIPGSLGPRSGRKLGRTLDSREVVSDSGDSVNAVTGGGGSQPQQPSLTQLAGSSPPPSKTVSHKDTHGLWKSVQDCHASLTVSNPRHFEFAVANLCYLLKGYGRELDDYAKHDLDRIFQTIRLIILDPSKRPSTRMQLLKVIELRARRWDSKQAKQPTKDKRIENMARTKPADKVETEKPVPSTVRSPPGFSASSAPRTPVCPKPCAEVRSQSSSCPCPSPCPDPCPKSTGFWDAVTLSQGYQQQLASIPEEARAAEGQLTSPSRSEAGSPGPLTMASPPDRKKEEPICNGEVPIGGRRHCKKEGTTKNADAPNLGAALIPPSDPMPSDIPTTPPPVASPRSSSNPAKYSREFLLQCWDSPLCRVMPAALQHTIPHSDIHFIVRIPNFIHPSFLLTDDSTPHNIKSAVLSQYVDTVQRKRHVSCPTTMFYSPKTDQSSGPSS